MDQTTNEPRDSAMARLDDQIAWYDKRSKHCQLMYKMLKSWTILAAAGVPLVVAFGLKDPRVPAFLGATIAVVEGLQQLNQYHENWISYRSTCEALRHEKHLFLSGAGIFASAENPARLLAERVENLVSQEQQNWTSGGEQAGRDKKG